MPVAHSEEVSKEHLNHVKEKLQAENPKKRVTDAFARMMAQIEVNSDLAPIEHQKQ